MGGCVGGGGSWWQGEAIAERGVEVERGYAERGGGWAIRSPRGEIKEGGMFV